MAASAGKFCVLCNTHFTSVEKTKSIALPPRNMNESYHEIMSFVFSQAKFNKSSSNSFTPVKPKRLESRIICQKCGVAMKNAYVALQQIIEFMVTDSYVHNHFVLEDESVEGDNVSADTSLAQDRHIPAASTREAVSSSVVGVHTPIKQKINNAYESDFQRVAMQDTIKSLLQNEIKTFAKYSSLKNWDFQNDDFSNSDLLTEMMEFCPTVLKCFYGIFGRSVTDEFFSPYIRLAASLAGFSQTQTCNGLQKMIGLCLYRDGASRKSYKLLNTLGVSLSYDAVVQTVDKLRLDLDEDLFKWKSGVESFCTSMATLPTFLQTQAIDPHLESLELPEGVVPLGGVYQIDAAGGEYFRAKGGPKNKVGLSSGQYYSITFSFDNLNKHVVPRHYSSAKKTQVLNMTSAFATFSRIPMKWTDLESSVPRPLFSDLPLSVWLPTSDDFTVIKYDMKREIRKTLVSYMRVFSSLASTVEVHTPHKFTKQSNEPSCFVPLGIFNIDENTTDGMLEIIRRLNKYVPHDSRGKKIPLVAFGDGLSTDRMRAAQESVLNADKFSDVNSELVPGNSSWHKRVLLLHDDFKVLMNDVSNSTSEGTLANFRSRFSHVKASSNVEKAFNHSYALMKFTAQSYVLAFATNFLMLEKQSLDSVPDEIKEIAKDKGALQQLLEKVVDKVFTFLWLDVERSIVQRKYCVCESSWEESRIHEFVGCDYRECHNQMWYHKSCLVKAQKMPNNFLRKPPTAKQKTWYCSTKCATSVLDKKYQYSKFVMFSGMLHESFKSAIKENDGMRMQVYHKLHMVQFFNKGIKHPLYLRIYHGILALMANGPPSARHDLLHNSTINFKGYPGGNLSMDFVNELINKNFKENLLQSKGNLTPEVIERRTQSLWLLSEIRRQVLEQLEQDFAQSRSKDSPQLRKDLQDAVRMIIAKELFLFKGERHHSGLQDLDYSHIYIEDVEAFRVEMRRLSRRMDQVVMYMTEERANKRRK